MSIELNISEKNIKISEFKVGSVIEYNNNGEWIPAEITNIHNMYEHDINYELKGIHSLPYYTILFPNNTTKKDFVRNACNCSILLPQRITQSCSSRIRIKSEQSSILTNIFSLFN